MLKKLILASACLAVVLTAEIRTSYATLEKRIPFQPDLKTEPVDKHSLFKKEANPEPDVHPVFKHGAETKNEGRGKGEHVLPDGNSMKINMLNDQSASVPMSTEINRIDNVQVPNYGFIPATDVAYPDIPYAPGYGYDSAYAPSNGYDMYSNPLSYYPEPDTSMLGLLWSQVPDARTMVSLVGRTIGWIFNSLFVLAAGSIITVALCSYTNLCSIAFHGVGPIHEEMRSLVTPERLEKISNAADFVKNAIDKYQKIQQVTDATRARRSLF